MKRISIFFFFSLLFHLSISYLAQYVVPYLGFFPYHDVLEKLKLPAFLIAFANFDGVHYLKIAQFGYQEYTQAFFPLYPLLITILTYITKNYFFSALIVSNVSFFLALLLFDKYLKTYNFSLYQRNFILIFLLIFPTAFFFNAVYTESLFFLFLIATLYFFRKNIYILSFLTGFLAATTRLIGIFVIIPLLFELLTQLKKQEKYIFSGVISMVSPLLGFAGYALYLFQTTGDPFFFFNSQPYFGAQRSTHLIIPAQVVFRYLKIIVTADHNFRYFVSLVEFSIFIFVSLILLWELYTLLKNKEYKFDRIGLNIFSWINLLLPTFTGTFSSVPRYSLMCLSFFMVLGALKNLWLKIILAEIFFVLQITLLIFFVQGYFVS